MRLKFEYKVALAYLIFGGLWILFSDRLLEQMLPDISRLTHFQTFKGWFFVVITAFLLFLFVKRHLRLLSESRNALLQKNEKLQAAERQQKQAKDEYYSLYEEYKAQAEDLLRTRKKVEESERYFRMLLENAPDAIFIQTDWEFAYVNKKGLELFRAENSEQLLGKNILDHVHPDYHAKVKERIKGFNEDKLTQPIINEKLKRLDGSYVEAEVSGVPVKYKAKDGGLVFIRDITEQRTHTREIEKKNTFIQTILDNLPIGVALNKIDEGSATYMNDKFVEIYGWPAEELVDISRFFEKVYPDKEYRNALLKRITEDINSGIPERMHWENIEITQKDGSKRYVNAVNIPLFDQNTMVSTVMDITELKEKVQELQKAKEKSEEANRLKTAFLQNISHEVRTPMNAITGFSKLLSQPGISNEKLHRYINVINQSSNQLLAVISNILVMSSLDTRQETPDITEVFLNDMLEELLSIYKIRIDAKDLEIELIKGLEGKDATIQTDLVKLNQILMNLLDNAVKFTNKGTIHFGYYLKDKQLEFFVEDNGIGVSPDQKEQVFERFIQADMKISRDYEGMGLGLSIAKGFVELLGGSIWLDSEPGKGATFFFTVPYIPSGRKTKNEEVQEELIKGEVKKILVAEDKELNYLLIEEILSEFDFSIIRALDGEEAIKTCEKHMDIALVLMDIKMPVMDGHEAAKQIKAKKPDLPIIAQSAYAMPEEVNRYKDVFDGFITKPISANELLGEIKKQLDLVS